MNFLGHLLPGFRELRAPVVAGGAWALVAALLAWPHRREIHNDLTNLFEIVSSAWHLAPAVVLAVMAVALYALGVVMQSLTTLIIHLLAAVGRKIVRYGRRISHETDPVQTKRKEFIAKRFRRSREWRQRLHPIPQDAVEHVRAIIRRSFASQDQAGWSPGEQFPITAVLQDSDATLQRLASDRSEQFQFVDRSRSEAEFKLASGPPTIVSGVLLSSNLPLAFILVVTGLALCALALRDTRRASSQLWIAAFLGFVESPLLTAAVESYGVHRTTHQDDDVKSARNWLYQFLRDVGVDYRLAAEYDPLHSS